MSNKPPDDKDGLVELLKKLWLPIAGFIGAVTLAYNFYQLWSGDQATVTYVTAGVGLAVLVIVLGWIGFSRKIVERDAERPFDPRRKEKVSRYPRAYQWIARISLGIILAGLAGGAWLLWKNQQELRNKVVVLVAQFDGPEETYGLHNQIMENLLQVTKDYKDTIIIDGNEVVTAGEGSEYARALGEKRNADLVIWAWYRPTENPNITIHIENLSTTRITVIHESEAYQPQATRAQLEHFELQRKLGSETSTLITFLTGMLRYESGDYQTAKERFEQILKEKDLSTFINLGDLYFNLGYSNHELKNYPDAILDYDKVIEINPQDTSAYLNRGNVYSDMKQYQRAVQDYDTAIGVDSQYEDAYFNRGLAHGNLGETDLAIQDYDRALGINPHDSYAYNNRGWIYYNLKEYERAVQDFNKAIENDSKNSLAYINRGLAYDYLGDHNRAFEDYRKTIELDPRNEDAFNNRGSIYLNYYKNYNRAIQDFNKAVEINPKFANAYNHRGQAYSFLKEYDRAIQDFDKAIEIDPEYADAYAARAAAYFHLGEYEHAIQDFDKALEINPQYSEIYRVRGLAYRALGKTAEAEADFKKYEELTGKQP